jgi:cyanate permease
METGKIKVYGYRWMVLLVYMLVVLMNQMLWITFASITGDATKFYGVSDLSIGLLSLVFMVVYIIVSFPASWAIDTYGVRIGVGIGAALTGLFGIVRGVWGSNYTLVLIAQIGIAVGQPFVLNAVTTVAARWFPVRDRATATGLGTLAIYLGIFLGLGLTPFLVQNSGIAGTLLVYGIAALVAAVLFFALMRERPATPPCPPELEVRSLVVEGLRKIFRIRDFILLLIIFFVGLGIFNAVTTWIEEIISPRGFTSDQAGIVGGLMIVGGILGALVIPTISDRLRRRTPFIVIALVGATVGLLGVTFATSYSLLIAASLVLGFFLLSAGPIGFQYAAEITYPTPEGTSNGLSILMGQISGIIFIVAMDSLKSPVTGSMTPSLIGMIGLLVISLVLSFFMKEPTSLLIQGSNGTKSG